MVVNSFSNLRLIFCSYFPRVQRSRDQIPHVFTRLIKYGDYVESMCQFEYGADLFIWTEAMKHSYSNDMLLSIWSCCWYSFKLFTLPTKQYAKGHVSI